MAINLLAGAFALLVLILMVMTRSGQPRVQRRLASEDPNFMFWGGDAGSGDAGCGSDGGGCGDGGGSCGDGGGGAGD